MNFELSYIGDPKLVDHKFKDGYHCILSNVFEQVQIVIFGRSMAVAFEQDVFYSEYCIPNAVKL